MKLTKDDIGSTFAQQHWTDCYFKLIDVGHSTTWGIIMSRINDEPIIFNQLFDIGEEWQPYTGKWTNTKKYISQL